MVFSDEKEKKIAIKIEEIKSKIKEAESMGRDSRFLLEQLELVRFQYSSILFSREPKAAQCN